MARGHQTIVPTHSANPQATGRSCRLEQRRIHQTKETHSSARIHYHTLTNLSLLFHHPHAIPAIVSSLTEDVPQFRQVFLSFCGIGPCFGFSDPGKVIRRLNHFRGPEFLDIDSESL